MSYYGATAQERAMKVQEVILRALAKKITWWQAAEILGVSDRQMRRWKTRYQEYGYDGLWDRRRGRSSGILCVNGSPLREGMKTPAILHRLSHVSQAAIG
ncbi:MAG: helix-turn-helix domain-containing protein [Acidobacteriota bacterium]|nr:helix-turn-helix domain-containing protein [Acidobacteriota bacterium]